MRISRPTDFVIYRDKLISYKGDAQHVIVPESVSIIGAGAFANNKIIKRVTLPKGLKRIQAHAFENCFALEQIDMPETLELLGEAAFCNCYTLENIVIPEGVECIGYRTFRNCHSLKLITLPNSLINIVTCEDIFLNDKLGLTVRAPKNIIELILKREKYDSNIFGIGVKVNYETIET